MSEPIKFNKDSFVRNLVKGNLLVPFLERYDEWDRPFNFEYTPKVGDDGWHPSGDCTPSVMDLYEKAMGQGEPEVISPSLQRIFLVGHFWHQVIQDALVRMEFAAPEAIERKGRRAWGNVSKGTHVWSNGDSTSLEVVLPPKPYHYATGSGDVAPLILPNWEGILDIKTMNSRSWDVLNKYGRLPEWSAAKYEAQLNIYMDFFDQPAGMILAVNKDTSGFAEIVFERNQDLIDMIYEKWQYVSDCIDKNHQPLPEADAIFALPLTGPVS